MHDRWSRQQQPVSTIGPVINSSRALRCRVNPISQGRPPVSWGGFAGQHDDAPAARVVASQGADLPGQPGGFRSHVPRPKALQLAVAQDGSASQSRLGRRLSSEPTAGDFPPPQPPLPANPTSHKPPATQYPMAAPLAHHLRTHRREPDRMQPASPGPVQNRPATRARAICATIRLWHKLPA